MMTLRPPTGPPPKHPSPREALHAALRQDFLTFVQMVFRTLEPGQKLHMTWYVEAMCAAALAVFEGRKTRLIVNVPPRSLKSIIFSVALPAFMLGRNPSAKIMCVSYGEVLALKFSRDCLKVAESAWFKEAFPKAQFSSANNMKLETNVGGYRLATSVGAVGLGLGADLIIIDDPSKGEDAQSQAGRDRVERFYNETLYGRFHDVSLGRIVLLMQRLNEDDLTGRLLAKEAWTHLNFPAVSDVDDEVDLGGGRKHQRQMGDLLDAVRLSQANLDRIRQTVGSDIFSAQYLQVPLPGGGRSIIKPEWLRTYMKPLDYSGMNLVQSWDTAIKGDPSNDPSVCTTWAAQNGNHYLIDVHCSHMDFPELVQKAAELHNGYGRHVTVLVEAQGSGVQLMRMLAREYQITTIERRSSRDKAGRLSDCSPLIEAGRVFLPDDAGWLPTYKQELLAFPQVRHDDQVDSTSQYLLWWMVRTSFSASWI